MNKKSIMTIRVPDDLKRRINKVAEEQGVSLNQFALYAFTKEIGELETNEYLKRRLKGKTKEEIYKNFDLAMEKVKAREVPEWDKV